MELFIKIPLEVNLMAANWVNLRNSRAANCLVVYLVLLGGGGVKTRLTWDDDDDDDDDDNEI